MVPELLAGLSWQLHGAGVATWSPTVPYEQVPGFDPDVDWAVTWFAVPETPSRLLVLSTYTPVDDVAGESSIGVQVRFRGDQDPNSVLRRSEAVFALWQDLAGVDVGGVPVALINRSSSAVLGQDDNQRHELSDNYRVRFDRSTVRI